MNPQVADLGNPQQQALERLRTAVNVLVTVSNNPSVDQLAAAVGFTLTLNKMGKHATAVYSGETPSTIEFLKPETTLEKNTDSLRDFIVSLDKSKADKLRYKVEDNVVKIFITPYKTSLSEKDLEFSQGDFNVDAVVALGVTDREQLDQAIVAHGRILHDATVITVSAGEKASNLGVINWQDTSASSLCEMLVNVGETLQPGLLDNQIATAYLTGIVAQTERFRNSKTTPKIMTMSAQLMAAGADQQLIASSLEKVVEVPVQAPAKAPEKPAASSSDGALTIDHPATDQPKTEMVTPAPEPEAKPVAKSDPSKESAISLDMAVKSEDTPKETANEIEIDDQGILSPAEQKKMNQGRHRLVEPLPGQSSAFSGGPHPFSANMTNAEEDEPSSDPLTAADMKAGAPANDEPGTSLPPIPEPAATSDPQTIPPAFDGDTLRNIEKTFDSNHIVKDPTSTINEIEEVEHSPHLEQAGVVDSARSAVESAINAAPYDPTRPEPLEALNATPLSMPADSNLVPQPANDASYMPNGGPPPVPPPMLPVQ